MRKMTIFAQRILPVKIKRTKLGGRWRGVTSVIWDIKYLNVPTGV